MTTDIKAWLKENPIPDVMDFTEGASEAKAPSSWAFYDACMREWVKKYRCFLAGKPFVLAEWHE